MDGVIRHVESTVYRLLGFSWHTDGCSMKTPHFISSFACYLFTVLYIFNIPCCSALASSDS